MKVFIAGCGVISAVGKNIKESIQTFQSTGITPSKTTVFETELPYPVFEVPNLQNVISEQRTYTLLKHALDEALFSTKLSPNELNNHRVGVCFGTTVACQLNDLGFYANFKKTKEVSIPAVKRYLNANLASLVKEKYNFKGPALTVVNACTSGTDAIGTAALWIQNGMCDIAIAGGADEINKIPLSGFGSLNNISEKPCCPFDKNRQGLNIGEGAGIVILVSEKITKKSKIKLAAEFSAYSTATDGYHLTAPSPEGVGLTKAITKALKMAHLDSSNIGFINAHGTSTKDNDLVEGSVFNKIFGSSIKFLSTKGITGHTLGAAGAIEAIFTILGLQNKWIPQSAGFKTFDEEIGLSPVSKLTEIDEDHAMSTSLAFGGNNSVLIFKKI
jgi:3-oxoacyl-[acyl-carrier-protein] synthase II